MPLFTSMVMINNNDNIKITNDIMYVDGFNGNTVSKHNNIHFIRSKEDIDIKILQTRCGIK